MATLKKKINELTQKENPVLGDSIVISDSENSGRGALVEITDIQTLIGGGGGGAVDSVAGKTGAVTLDAADIAETETLKILTATERTKLTGIEEGAEVNDVTSVAGKTGAVTLDAADISETETLKILTADERTKLTGIAENANNYTHPASHPQSMIEGLADALDGKAPLASPALTGTPTAPTAAPGTNSTQLATTAFCAAALAGKANDADVVKLTGNQSIGGTKTFTTSPVLPTPTAGDNTTKGATTAFVTGAIAACRPKHPYVAITTASTAIAAERGNTYGVNANGCTLTLPAATGAGYVDGDEICVFVGVSAARELAIVSPSYIVRGTGLQPVNTPFNVTGFGTFISFVKSSNVWTMIYPEYELSLKAPLASPALTGTPTAPTAAVGTNTTQLATTAFCAAGINAAIANAIYDLPVTRSGLVAPGTDAIIFETANAINPAWYDATHVLNVSFFARNDSGVYDNTTFKFQLYDDSTSTAHTIASITADTLNFDLLQASIYRGSSNSVNCNIQYGVASSTGYVSLASGSYKLRVVCTSTLSTIFMSAQVRFTK